MSHYLELNLLHRVHENSVLLTPAASDFLTSPQVGWDMSMPLRDARETVLRSVCI